jgi:hypothetical protein
MTNYRSSYSKDITSNKDDFIKSMRAFSKKQAGAPRNDNSSSLMKGRKKTTFLVGESYRDFEDPKQNTHCQRSWVYGKDSTLQKVEDKINKTLNSLGGSAAPQLLMSSVAKSKALGNKVGDYPNSLPIEGKKFVLKFF